MYKLTNNFKNQFSGKQFLYEDYHLGIPHRVKLHEEINHPRSSAIAYLNEEKEYLYQRYE